MLSFSKSPTQSPDSRPAVVLGEDETWLYEGSSIPAVGARDVTLGEAVDPLVIGRKGRDPDSVMLPLSALVKDQRLNWVLQAGTRLDGDEEPMFRVAWSVWQEHAAQPVGAWLPEHDAQGLDRALAVAERDVRFKKQALDEAILVRLRLFVFATSVGRSRRKVGKVTGLSPGRVQQLNEDPPEEVVEEVKEFLAAATRIATAIGGEPYRREEIPRPDGLGSDQFDQVVDSMLSAGLLVDGDSGIRLTGDGRFLIAAGERKSNVAT